MSMEVANATNHTITSSSTTSEGAKLVRPSSVSSASKSGAAIGSSSSSSHAVATGEQTAEKLDSVNADSSISDVKDEPRVDNPSACGGQADLPKLSIDTDIPIITEAENNIPEEEKGLRRSGRSRKPNFSHYSPGQDTPRLNLKSAKKQQKKETTTDKEETNSGEAKLKSKKDAKSESDTKSKKRSGAKERRVGKRKKPRVSDITIRPSSLDFHSHCQPSTSSMAVYKGKDGKLSIPDILSGNKKLRDFVNPAVFCRLSLEDQKELMRLLPPLDQGFTEDGKPKLSFSALNNAYFNSASEEFKERLENGWLLPDGTDAIKLGSWVSQHIDPWKLANVEEYWGQRLEEQKRKDEEFLPPSPLHSRWEEKQGEAVCSSTLVPTPPSAMEGEELFPTSSTSLTNSSLLPSDPDPHQPPSPLI